MKIVQITAYEDNCTVGSHEKHDENMTLKEVEEGKRD